MFGFLLLVLLLILTIIFFIVFPIIKKRVLTEKFDYFCAKKITKIAKRNGLYCITNLRITDFESRKINVNHVIFGRKFVYIISDYCLIGEISGEVDDNSWLYKPLKGISSNYLDNLSFQGSSSISTISEELGVNKEAIISIALIPNECNFLIRNINKQNNFVIHYSSLRLLIKRIENKNISSIKREQRLKYYEKLKEKNEREKRN